MKPEKQQLLDDLLGTKARSEITLAAGCRILRRRRYLRIARRSLGVIFLIVAGSFEFRREYILRHQTPKILAASVSTSSPVPMKSLTDEELLALFPNTPVGLATLSNGKKLLVFPRPRDEAKYVGRF
jgi:hypothetical protein